VKDSCPSVANWRFGAPLGRRVRRDTAQRVATGKRLPWPARLAGVPPLFLVAHGRLFPGVVDFIESPPSQPAATRHHADDSGIPGAAARNRLTKYSPIDNRVGGFSNPDEELPIGQRFSESTAAAGRVRAARQGACAEESEVPRRPDGTHPERWWSTCPKGFDRRCAGELIYWIRRPANVRIRELAGRHPQLSEPPKLFELSTPEVSSSRRRSGRWRGCYAARAWATELTIRRFSPAWTVYSDYPAPRALCGRQIARFPDCQRVTERKQTEKSSSASTGECRPQSHQQAMCALGPRQACSAGMSDTGGEGPAHGLDRLARPEPND